MDNICVSWFWSFGGSFSNVQIDSTIKQDTLEDILLYYFLNQSSTHPASKIKAGTNFCPFIWLDAQFRTDTCMNEKNFPGFFK